MGSLLLRSLTSVQSCFSHPSQLCFVTRNPQIPVVYNSKRAFLTLGPQTVCGDFAPDCRSDLGLRHVSLPPGLRLKAQ